MARRPSKKRDNVTEQITSLLVKGKTEAFKDRYLNLHYIDRINIFKQFDEAARSKIYQLLSPVQFSEIFQGLEIAEQKKLIKEMDHHYAVNMFDNMSLDDVVDFLGELDETTLRRFLDSMSHQDASEVKELMAYPRETAGSIMTTEFIAASAGDSVTGTIERLRSEGAKAETIYYLYVTDEENRLAGVASLRDLVLAQPQQRIEEIMNRNVISVLDTADQEDVANVIKDYDFIALPVIDGEDKLVGIVTVDDIIDVLEDEITEDIGEISAAKGALGLDLSSREASRKRLPWLILLLFIGMITAGIISRFEGTLEEVAMLAIFIPLIADMAGNTGTQSLAVVVRGLALGKISRDGVFSLIKREAGTGLIMGVVCGSLVSLISQFVTGGNVVLGFIIGFSLFCTLVVSTLTGAIVPLVINRFKIDPAVASGPFITTFNDIVGLLIYFSIATALIDYL